MIITDERYDRSRRLFGVAGQRKLSGTRVAVGGISGLGSPMVQHLGLLGVAHVAMIEPQELDNTNRNRFVGAKSTDPVPGSPKVDLAERLLAEINPHVAVTKIRSSIVSAEAFAAVKAADSIMLSSQRSNAAKDRPSRRQRG